MRSCCFSSPAIRSVIFQSHVFIFRRPVTCRPYVIIIYLSRSRMLSSHKGARRHVAGCGPAYRAITHWTLTDQMSCTRCIYLQRRKVAAVEEISKFHSASSRNSVGRSATGTVAWPAFQDFTLKDVRQRSIIVVELFNLLRFCSVQLCGQRLIG